MVVEENKNINPLPSAMKSETAGSGDTVLLVPGGLTGWISWEPHAKELSENYRVVRVQLLSVDLGLRKESLPKNYSVDYETRALDRAISENMISKADLVAWSYGAEIALNFALNSPDMIRTLTLIEPPSFWVLKGRRTAEKLQEEREMLQSFGPGEISESQLEQFVHFSGLVPPAINPKSLPQWSVWMEHRQSLRPGDVAFRHVDTIHRVRGFGKPVLLIKGKGSSNFLHEIIDVLGGEFPHARVEMLPGGHAPHLVSRSEFMNFLSSFLSQESS